MEYADLELALYRRDIESYSLDLRFNPPGDNADIRLMRDDVAPIRFDFSHLLSLSLDPLAYGSALTASLFADSIVLQAFNQAQVYANSQGFPLRLRLFIGQSALELHSLRWETLCRPDDDVPLLTSPDVLFSRYLSSRDWRPVRPRSRGHLSALGVIANPNDLQGYGLAPINVALVQAHISAAFGDLPHTILHSSGCVTLDNIVTQLLTGVDILYIVCHAKIVRGETYLCLDNGQGQSDYIAGSALVARLRDLVQRPRLVVLASCQTAGDGQQRSIGDSEALVALGPRLSEAGIPAVVAMNGNVSIETVEQFMTVFFVELIRDGQVDHAMAIARGVVRGRTDNWMPVLFMRLKNGQIWYAPSFSDDHQRGRGAEKWPVITQSIRNKVCTPIIGPDIAESLFGSRQDIAWQLAAKYEYPMDPHDRDGLPQVAQYLAVNQSPTFLPSSLAQYLVKGICDRHERLPDEIMNVLVDKSTSTADLTRVLDQLMNYAWHQRRDRVPGDPFSALAAMPLPVFITADQSNLLATALREAGKEPQICLCPWNDDLLGQSSLYRIAREPDVTHPLVYHLFGNLREPDSLVLTEDDLFDYLIGVTRNNDAIPLVVRDRLADSSLIFLGFRMEDWYFRVFFRTLMDQLGKRRRKKYAHVAVQIAPEEDRLLDPRRARRYLEAYFQDADISIFWGSAEDFATELYLHLGGVKP